MTHQNRVGILSLTQTQVKVGFCRVFYIFKTRMSFASCGSIKTASKTKTCLFTILWWKMMILWRWSFCRLIKHNHFQHLLVSSSSSDEKFFFVLMNMWFYTRRRKKEGGQIFMFMPKLLFAMIVDVFGI